MSIINTITYELETYHLFGGEEKALIWFFNFPEPTEVHSGQYYINSYEASMWDLWFGNLCSYREEDYFEEIVWNMMT